MFSFGYKSLKRHISVKTLQVISTRISKQNKSSEKLQKLYKLIYSFRTEPKFDIIIKDWSHQKEKLSVIERIKKWFESKKEK